MKFFRLYRLPIILKTSSLFILITLLNSCASSTLTSHLSDKCQNPNWHALGYKDGASGKNKKNLSQHYSDCTPSVIINEVAYDKGWRSGIAMYCNPRNGWKLGMEGKLYNNVCPDNRISAFDKAWRQGITNYCTAKNGYQRGLQGGDFPGFCPPYANLAFKKAYMHGHSIFLKLKALKDKYTELDVEVQDLKADIDTREKALKASQQTFMREAFYPGAQAKIQKDKIHLKHLATKLDHLIQERNSVLQKYNALLKAYES